MSARRRIYARAPIDAAASFALSIPGTFKLNRQEKTYEDGGTSDAPASIEQRHQGSPL